jgi:hypothetical protein
MARGRPPAGPKLVERLDGSEGAKARLRVILEATAGEYGVGEACARMGIGQAAFHHIRERALQTALGNLEPRPPGRPRRRKSQAEARIEALEAEIGELRIELRAAQVREEIALVMPHLLRSREPEPKKKRRDRRSGKRRPVGREPFAAVSRAAGGVARTGAGQGVEGHCVRGAATADAGRTGPAEET